MAWSGEEWLGGQGKAIAASRHGDGRVAIAYIASDDQIIQLPQNLRNGWAAPKALGAAGSAKDIALGSNSDGQFELFYVGADHRLYHLTGLELQP